MKICSPQLGISPESSLGGEIYDYQTLKGFTQKGIDVFVYLPKNRHYDKTLKHFHVEYCFITHIIPPWIYSFICLPYIYRTYKREKFDILRIHSPRFLGLAAIIFHLFFQNVPILSSQVTIDPSPFSYPVEWLTFRISKKIIVQSQYMKEIVAKKYHIDPKKIEVTYGGQINKSTNPIILPQQAKFLKENDKILLFMGFLIKRKNPLFLIDVFSQARKHIDHFKMVIIGNGPEKRQMVRELERLNLLQEVIFIDSAYGSVKDYWLSRMNAFLFPSRDEALGLSATEAMSFAKPVITSDIPPFKEIITSGHNGYALPLDAQLWVRTIVSLIKSPALSEKIGQAAKKTVTEKFNWQKTYDLNYKVARKMAQ